MPSRDLDAREGCPRPLVRQRQDGAGHLVVVGHSWVLLPDNAVTDHFYDFLYAWHVPAFVFVTGYLSRSFAYTRARMWQLVRTVVVPYVVFECALALFRVYVGGRGRSPTCSRTRTGRCGTSPPCSSGGC